HGAAGGSGAGDGLHAVDRRLHPLDLPAPRTRKDSVMSGSLHVGLASLAAAFGAGLIGMGSSAGVGRNPGSSTKVMVQSILAIAFAEAIVFYALFLVRGSHPTDPIASRHHGLPGHRHDPERGAAGRSGAEVRRRLAASPRPDRQLQHRLRGAV